MIELQGPVIRWPFSYKFFIFLITEMPFICIDPSSVTQA